MTQTLTVTLTLLTQILRQCQETFFSHFSHIFRHFLTFDDIQWHSPTFSVTFGHILSLTFDHIFDDIWWHFTTFLDHYFDTSNISKHLITFAELMTHIPRHFRPTFDHISDIQFPTFINILKTFDNILAPPLTINPTFDNIGRTYVSHSMTFWASIW